MSTWPAASPSGCSAGSARGSPDPVAPGDRSSSAGHRARPTACPSRSWPISWSAEGSRSSTSGADVPMGSFVHAARQASRLVAVGVVGHRAEPRRRGEDGGRAVHRDVPGVPVIVGGGAIVDEQHAGRLGADGYASDGRSFVDLLQGLPAPGRAGGAGSAAGAPVPRRAAISHPRPGGRLALAVIEQVFDTGAWPLTHRWNGTALRQLGDRARPLNLAGERVLPGPPGRRRGAARGWAAAGDHVATAGPGSASLALALVAGPSAAGSWSRSSASRRSVCSPPPSSVSPGAVGADRPARPAACGARSWPPCSTPSRWWWSGPSNGSERPTSAVSWPAAGNGARCWCRPVAGPMPGPMLPTCASR